MTTDDEIPRGPRGGEIGGRVVPVEEAGLHPRNPRLSFDEACRIV